MTPWWNKFVTFSLLIRFCFAPYDLYGATSLLRWQENSFKQMPREISSLNIENWSNFSCKITKMTPWGNKFVTFSLVIRFCFAPNDLYGATSLFRWQKNSFKQMPIEILSLKIAKWWNLCHKITKMTPWGNKFVTFSILIRF